MVWFGPRHPGKHEFANQVDPEERFHGDIIFNPSPIPGGGHLQITENREEVPELYLTNRQKRILHPEVYSSKRRGFSWLHGKHSAA